ncbi:hypothetical protein MLD38_018738 [Melastoma candidum]|uniref:Uncharacterized protein n=1 Tax=Melastoma candidum TaxID=119954 RepID=A0ACB9QUP4_9MYRT|nr:hypothetical protein MLD38_018738 [Melastoma candidum]
MNTPMQTRFNGTTARNVYRQRCQVPLGEEGLTPPPNLLPCPTIPWRPLQPSAKAESRPPATMRNFRRYLTLRHSHDDHRRFSKSGSLTSRLQSRSVIRFAGPDTVKFLQGLLTNDVHGFLASRLEKPSFSAVGAPNTPAVVTSPLYAALLTPQGRFLYDFFLYKRPEPEERLDPSGSGPGQRQEDGEMEVFADVDGRFLEEIVQTFRRFRLRSKVEIENVTEDFSCWQRYGSYLSRKPLTVEEPEAASVGWGAGIDRSAVLASQAINGWRWFRDPRLDCLGFRGIFPSGTAPPLVEVDKETVEDNFVLWRIEKGVAEGSTEIPKGEAIPLEYNLEGLNAISFDKGCYVGQELIARTHHRGVIRKRLVPLMFLDNQGKEVEQKVVPGSDVVDASSGKRIGIVTISVGCQGLGLLRLEEALRRSASLTILGEEDLRVEARKPDWWPPEWIGEAGEGNAVG